MNKYHHAPKHPYLMDEKWVNGTLCFWRDSPNLYSKKTIMEYEKFVNKLKDKLILKKHL